MFGTGPSRDEHTALADIVRQQSAVLAVNQEHAAATSEVIDLLSEAVEQFRAESLVLKGMIGAIFAEIASRRDDPFGELNGILRRARFVADEFSIDRPDLAHHAASAKEFICQYASDYLRRGERS